MDLQFLAVRVGRSHRGCSRSLSWSVQCSRKFPCHTPAEAREGQGLVAYFSSHRMCGKGVLGIEAALREAEKALNKHLDSGVAAQRRPFNRGVETRRRSSRYSLVAASEAP